MPGVAVFVADTRQVGTRAFGTPEHGVIVLRLDCERVGPVPVNLVAQGSNHLAVARITSLTDVDVASRQFQRRVKSHVRRRFNSLIDREKRCDLDNAADTGGCNDSKNEADRGTLEFAVKKFAHFTLPPAPDRRDAEHHPGFRPCRATGSSSGCCKGR